MLFLVTEESVKLTVDKCYMLLPCSSIQSFLQTATISRWRNFRNGLKKMTEPKTGRREKQSCYCASISILGVQTFVQGAKPPEAPRGDVIGAINPLKHLALPIPSVLLDTLQ